MQYIKNGPDIPEEIEHARRKNELVLFCGAGISVQNGLPLFKDLVQQVCTRLNNIDINKYSTLQTAWERKQYDSILDLIEGDESFSVPRETLRKEVLYILNHHTGTPEIHKALLDLSALPDNTGYRLVTTNFDKLFFEAGLKPALSDSAPKLAPPRKETWKNLTFLHGVIDTKYNSEGNNLVLTRKDFGRAYLLDYWATRFVIQLFQDFTILFIGYGVNDPVMNYLVSAISDENQRRKQNDNNPYNDYRNSNQNNTKPSINDYRSSNQNNTKPSIYAFARYQEGKEESAKEKWTSIGVEPIPYKISNNDNHDILYNTITEWAKWKKTGLTGRQLWLKEKLKSKYKDSDKEEARNIISFLKTDDKLAEYFPKINFNPKVIPNKPVDISWLKPLSENGLLNKLTKKTIKPVLHQMPLWETLLPIEYHITDWLLYHLDKKELIHWIINQGCILHPSFKYMIRWEMEYKERTKDNTSPLDKRILLFWETITNNNCVNYQPIRKHDIDYGIIPALNNKQYCSNKVQKLLEALKPYIQFNKPYMSDSFLKENPEFTDTTYEVELKINTDHYPYVDLTDEKTLLLHAEDFSNLLKKAMELAKSFEIIKNGDDYFCITRPSIEQHSQNKKYNAWTYLIDLVRDSFDLAMKKNKPLGRFLLNKWKLYPYSIFYRLIFYAITKYPELEENIAIDLLESNPAHTLWSSTSQNEVFKYLRARQHSKEAIKTLFSLIMKGPPRNLMKKDIDESFFTELKEKEIFKRLYNLKKAQVLFPEKIEKFYKEIQTKYSSTLLKSAEDDRHDFPYFQTGPVLIGNKKRYHNLTPQEIYAHLKDSKNTLWWPNEKAKEFLSLAKDNPDKAFKVLLMFQENDMESSIYWSAFLSGITEINDTQQSNQYFKKALEKLEKQTDEFIQKCLGSLIYTWGMKAVLIYHEDKEYFKNWWKRLWKLSIQDKGDFQLDNNSDFSMGALNSKLGRLSDSIFHALWSAFDKTIPRNGKIPEEIKNYFNTIMKTGATKNPSVMFHFGSYLYNLWFLDKEWTQKNLKPLMGWEENDKNKISRALWEGYIYGMKVNPDFLSDFKAEFYKLFLNSQSFYTKPGSDHYDNQNRCLAVADLFLITTGGKWYNNIFTEGETKALKEVWHTDLLESLAIKILDLVKNSEDKSSNLWIQKLKPWIKEFWPQQKNMNTQKIAEYLSVVILYCGDNLPDAFEFLKYKIKDVITNNHYFIIHTVAESIESKVEKSIESKVEKSIESNQTQLDYVFDYPQDLLKILNWNLPETNTLDSFHGNALKSILDKLKTKHPIITKDEKYTTLREKIP